MSEKQCVIDGMIINYLISDNFNPENCYLFLHGWKQDSRSFKKILDIFENKKISFVSIDFPGFGKSSGLKNDWGIADYSEITYKFINKVGLVKPVLVAHSFGGRIAIYLGSKYEIVSRLVLIGAGSIKPRKKGLKYFIMKFGKIIFSIPGLYIIGKRLSDRMRSADYRSSNELKGTFLKVINEDISDLLPKIKIQTLLIWGEKDTETPLHQGIEMKNLIPNSSIKTFRDGTHFVFQEYPVEVTNLIISFKNDVS